MDDGEIVERPQDAVGVEFQAADEVFAAFGPQFTLEVHVLVVLPDAALTGMVVVGHVQQRAGDENIAMFERIASSIPWSSVLSLSQSAPIVR